MYVFFFKTCSKGEIPTRKFSERDAERCLIAFGKIKGRKKKMGQSYDSLNTAREAYIRRGSYLEEKYQRQEEGKKMK